MADAEAIAEAASRPTMRFVEVKSEEGFGPGNRAFPAQGPGCMSTRKLPIFLQ